jgi:protocatechuate 3,4-dioxygenase beta subunit
LAPHARAATLLVGLLVGLMIATLAAAPADEPKAESPNGMEVVVRGEDTGAPLKDAAVEVSYNLKKSLLRTDRDGKVRIDLANATFDENLILDVGHEGFVSQRHAFSRGRAPRLSVPERLDVALNPGEETLGGRVVDEAGRPIAGVKVTIWGELGELKDEHERGPRPTALTDARGEWRCRCFRKMKFAYLYLSHPDYVADNESHRRRHFGPNPQATGLPEPNDGPLEALRDFSDMQVMTRGVELTGTVVDERGKPVAGAEVGWFESERRNTRHDELTTTSTDAAGQFRFAHVRPGAVTVQAKAAGHAPGLKAGEAGVKPITVELGAPHVLAGRIVDAQGRPLAGARVDVTSWRGTRALGVSLKADAEGRFAWKEAPADVISLNVWRYGYANLQVRRAMPDQEEIRLELKRSLEIGGRVLDAQSGDWIARAEVEVGVPGAKPGEFVYGKTGTTITGANFFQTTLDADTASEFRLRIRAKGYEPLESRTFRNDEGDVRCDVKLKKTRVANSTGASGDR